MTDANVVDSVLKLLEILSIIGATGVFVFKLGRATTRFEMVGVQQGKEIGELKIAVKELSGIVVSQAVQTQRLDNQAERITLLEKRVEELRHGRGFVYPFAPPQPQPG